MKFQVPCLDGSVRELVIPDHMPFTVKGFTETHPAVGQYFYYYDSLFLRTDAVVDAKNVWIVTTNSTYMKAMRNTDFTRHPGGAYLPINIWTGEWL